MKCTNCGHEMPDNAKFCEMCGKPFDIEQTQLADDDIRDDFNNFNARENNPPQNDYVNNGSPDRPYDDRYHEDRRYINEVPAYAPPQYNVPGYNDPRVNDPRINDPNLYPGSQKPPMSGQKKALIISAVALGLVIAILTGVIIYVSRTKVSAKELDEAKENFLPPAQVYQIDAALVDPSDDNIKFKYDSRARISSCTYAVNDRTYDQSYGYNDKTRVIKIDTKYRNHTIFSKEIGYDRVEEANKFVAVDGYYIRLDDTSLGSESSSSVPVETAAPKAAAPMRPAETQKPTEKPTEQPTETPKATSKPKATEKPTEPPADWRDIYIDFLNGTSINYSSGILIYINNDDTPELVLYTTGSAMPTYICYISDGIVKSFKTDASDGIDYSKRSGYFVSGRMHMGAYSGTIYYFDGDSVTEDHTVFCPDINGDEYQVDGDSMTKSEYEAFIADFSFVNEDSKFVLKHNLPKYIRSFE